MDGIDGVLTWIVDAIHRFDNNCSRDAKALWVITPAAIGPQYFRQAAEVINAVAGGPPDRVKITSLRSRPATASRRLHSDLRVTQEPRTYWPLHTRTILPVTPPFPSSS